LPVSSALLTENPELTSLIVMNDQDSGAEQKPVAVIGTQLGAARAAQRRHVPAGPSPLADVSYEHEAGALWRWVDQPADAVIAAVTARYAGSDEPARAVLRSSLAMNDLYTLLTFARRRALAAIRTAAAAPAIEALDALSMIDIDRVDWRDVVSAARFACYTAGQVGAAPAIAKAARRAAPPVADILTKTAGRELDLERDYGYRLVVTPDGPVLFSLGYAGTTPTGGGRNLAPLALIIAAIINSDPAYRVGDVHADHSLPPVWLGRDADPRAIAAIEAAREATEIHASPVDDPNPFSNFLNVWLMQTRTAADTAAIAAAAESRPADPARALMPVAAGCLCAVVVAASSVQGVPCRETPASLARFRPDMQTLITVMAPPFG
jgi:hypothetical protein